MKIIHLFLTFFIGISSFKLFAISAEEVYLRYKPLLEIAAEKRKKEDLQQLKSFVRDNWPELKSRNFLRQLYWRNHQLNFTDLNLEFSLNLFGALWEKDLQKVEDQLDLYDVMWFAGALADQGRLNESNSLLQKMEILLQEYPSPSADIVQQLRHQIPLKKAALATLEKNYEKAQFILKEHSGRMEKFKLPLQRLAVPKEKQNWILQDWQKEYAYTRQELAGNKIQFIKEKGSLKKEQIKELREQIVALNNQELIHLHANYDRREIYKSLAYLALGEIEEAKKELQLYKQKQSSFQKNFLWVERLEKGISDFSDQF